MTQTKAAAAASQTITPFDRNLTVLDGFVEEHGHASVPQLYVTTDGVQLGLIVKGWRQQFKAGRLSQDRIDALEARTGWVWSASRKNRTVASDGTIARITEDPFDERIRALRLFAHEHGHTQVPGAAVTLTGVSLGAWVQNQRNMYSNRFSGKAESPGLADDRVAALEAVPHWTWTADGYSVRWEANYASLEAEVAVTGTALLGRRDTDPAKGRLGKWVALQRVRYGKGKLSAERIAKLEALPGWVWDASLVNDTFNGRIAELRAYIAEHPGRTYPRNLAVWASRRRVDYARGELSQTKVDALNALPGWKWLEGRKRSVAPTPPRKTTPRPKQKNATAARQRPLSATMQANLARIAAYAKTNGHARVPHLHVEEDGMRLGLVVKNLQDRQSTLHPDMVNGLNAIPGWTWTKPAAWDLDEALAALDTFVAEHGHARVPRGYVTNTGVPLGNRVETWRRQALTAQMPAGLVRELESKPGWLWSRGTVTLAA